MTTDYETMFWLLMLTAVIGLIGIMATAKSLMTFIKSDVFIEKLKERGSKGASVLIIIMSVLPLEMLAQAAESAEATAPMFQIGKSEVVVMLIVNIIFIGVILFLRKMLRDMLEMVAPQTVEEKSAAKKRSFAFKWRKVVWQTVDIEEEDSILLDHDYDGIQELDNNLPPWWTYGFYLTIVVGVIYLLNYHVLGTGDLQIEAYEKEVYEAELAVQAYLEESALNVDETTVIMLEDAVAIENGHKIWSKNCAVCHQEDGGGQVGPNMTDDYWIYGPDIKDIFKTVKYGAKNGMTAWKEKLTPVEIQEVSSYIKTLHGTQPQNPKEPQGELFQMMVDTTAAAPVAQSDTIVLQ